MTVLGTIEITETVSKTRDVAWWTTWTEVGDRAMYQTDPNAEEAIIKAIDQLRRLSGHTLCELTYRVIGPTGPRENGTTSRDRGLLIEVSC